MGHAWAIPEQFVGLAWVTRCIIECINEVIGCILKCIDEVPVGGTRVLPVLLSSLRDMMLGSMVVHLDGLVWLFAVLVVAGMVGHWHVVVILGPPSSLASIETLWPLHLTLVWLVVVADCETPLAKFSLLGLQLLVQHIDCLAGLGVALSGSLSEPLRAESQSIVLAMAGEGAEIPRKDE